MQYVQWKKGNSGTRFDFYTNGEVKKSYKKNIVKLLNRRNTKNGRLYKEDPTIMCVLHTRPTHTVVGYFSDVSHTLVQPKGENMHTRGQASLNMTEQWGHRGTRGQGVEPGQRGAVRRL